MARPVSLASRRSIVTCQPSQHRHDLCPAGQVEEGGRLIQQHDNGFLGERPRNHDFLSFAVTQFIQHAIG